MKICIPVATDTCEDAAVYGHFGSAPYFAIFDSETDIFSVVANPNQDHIHGACRPLSVVDRNSVDIVICKGMGVRAVQELNKAGIKAYLASGDTVKEVIAKWQAGDAEIISVANACTQHECD